MPASRLTRIVAAVGATLLVAALTVVGVRSFIGDDEDRYPASWKSIGNGDSRVSGRTTGGAVGDGRVSIVLAENGDDLGVFVTPIDITEAADVEFVPFGANLCRGALADRGATVGPAGFVVAGLGEIDDRGVCDGQSIAFTSADGRTWRKVDLGGAPDLHRSVLSDSEGFLQISATGIDAISGPERHDPAPWPDRTESLAAAVDGDDVMVVFGTVDDARRAWRWDGAWGEIDVSDWMPYQLEGTRTPLLLSTDAGFVFVRTSSPPPADRSERGGAFPDGVWISPNGDTWSPVDIPELIDGSTSQWKVEYTADDRLVVVSDFLWLDDVVCFRMTAPCDLPDAIRYEIRDGRATEVDMTASNESLTHRAGRLIGLDADGGAVRISGLGVAVEGERERHRTDDRFDRPPIDVVRCIGAIGEQRVGFFVRDLDDPFPRATSEISLIESGESDTTQSIARTPQSSRFRDAVAGDWMFTAERLDGDIVRLYSFPDDEVFADYDASGSSFLGGC